MTASGIQTVQTTETLTILQRLANKNQSAVKDCIDGYGNLIWALARKFTASREEAEAATLEIFLDIWRYAENAVKFQPDEKVLISLIAQRRLIKHLQ